MARLGVVNAAPPGPDLHRRDAEAVITADHGVSTRLEPTGHRGIAADGQEVVRRQPVQRQGRGRGAIGDCDGLEPKT